MIVGEAPDEREEDIRKPFSGTAGKLLDRMLEEAGLSRDRVYITNVVHCRPPDNRTPTKDEIQACKKYLQAEMDLVKPKYVLLLGNVALQGVLGRSGIRSTEGRYSSRTEFNIFPHFTQRQHYGNQNIFR